MMNEDFELVLFDRLNVIKDTIQKFGEENFFLSFSGGKDSTILHYLIDMAIPENKIPRVYSNTGIEYKKNVEFVKNLASKDDRFIILNPSVKIKKTLDKYGYPFKSKEYSQWHKVFKNNEQEARKVIKQVEKNPELLKDYDFIHNLPKGTKWTIKYIYGLRERESNIYKYGAFP